MSTDPTPTPPSPQTGKLSDAECVRIVRAYPDTGYVTQQVAALRQQVADLTAERDAYSATMVEQALRIGRVRRLADEWERDYEFAHKAQYADELRAALTPDAEPSDHASGHDGSIIRHPGAREDCRVCPDAEPSGEEG